VHGPVEPIRAPPDLCVVYVAWVNEKKPIGGPPESPLFLNIVVIAETTLEPQTLVERAFAIEDAFGRTRDSGRWGPRTLDVDLIMVGNAVVDQEDLRLPHPLAHERAFVLVPWYEVDPTAEIIGKGAIGDLLSQADASGVVRRDDLVIDRDCGSSSLVQEPAGGSVKTQPLLNPVL